jgi:hypothetical protein
MAPEQVAIQLTGLRAQIGPFGYPGGGVVAERDRPGGRRMRPDDRPAIDPAVTSKVVGACADDGGDQAYTERIGTVPPTSQPGARRAMLSPSSQPGYVIGRKMDSMTSQRTVATGRTQA